MALAIPEPAAAVEEFELDPPQPAIKSTSMPATANSERPIGRRVLLGAELGRRLGIGLLLFPIW
ncbi:MAG: hypothetical protein DLM63_01240 [Solirubrobacterales bacterium]|nr:MAG: hypothetical protein DLM63_01240 [Solirubrobacterales bacterium]